MPKRAISSATFLAALLAAPVAAQPDAPPVRIESSLREAVEACPIRILIPLREWLDGKRKPVTFPKSRMVECDGAKVAFVGVEEHRGAMGRGLAVDPRVSLASYEDRRIIFRAVLLATDGSEISKAEDDLPGDRGEINWGANLKLPFRDREDDAADLLLEVRFRPR